MRVLALLIGIYFLPLITNAAAEESPIDWELRYPINLFGKASRAEPRVLFRDPEAMQYDWGYQRDLYVSADCAADKNPILCSEIRLGPNRIANMKAMMSGGNSADPNNNSNVRNVMIATGSGYNQDTRLYSTKKEDLHPIKVRLSLNVWKDYKCQWSRDDLALPVWITQCGDWLKNISIKRGEDSSTLTVKVLDPNGGAPVFETKISGTQTRVKTRLILGFGDSFASGEGNPDIPVKLSDKYDGDRDFPLPERPHQIASEPNQQDAAQWLDRGCHRSLLGSQQRAVIAYAAKHPKEETTFLAYACSGAQIYQGIIGPYSGSGETTKEIRIARDTGNLSFRSPPRDDEYWRTDMSQLNRAILFLCREKNETRTPDYKTAFNNAFSKENRKKGSYADAKITSNQSKLVITCPSGVREKIDAVLLSIGGNDIGFAKAIGKVVYNGYFKPYLLSNGLIQEPTKSKKQAEEDLPAKYNNLHKSLMGYFHLKSAKQIIVPLYPDALNDGQGNSCNTKKGLEAFPHFDWGNSHGRNSSDVTKEETTSLRSNLLVPLNKVIQTNNYGWTIASTGAEQFKTHGWCATGDLSAEDKFCKLENNRCVPPSASTFNAYALTQRWFRSINDSYFVQNQFSANSEVPFFKDALGLEEFTRVSGMLHPNGLGAAAIADSYLKSLETVIEP